MARGRKVNSNGERSKQLLLDKAIELFSKHGYYETKISDIVKAANLTQPTFYLYFQSKDKLYLDLNEEFKRNLLAIVNEKVKAFHNNEITIRQFMLESIENAFVYFSENPNLTKIGFYDSQLAIQLKEQLVELIEDTLRASKLATQGDIQLNVLANSILGSIERLTLTYILSNNASPKQLAHDILKIYFMEPKEVVTA